MKVSVGRDKSVNQASYLLREPVARSVMVYWGNNLETGLDLRQDVSKKAQPSQLRLQGPEHARLRDAHEKSVNGLEMNCSSVADER